jgi:hypothetical protein
MRTWAAGAAVLIWLLWIGAGAAKLRAMQQYTIGTYDAVRNAAVLDPESYRVQLRAAEVQSARGYCKLAYHNAMNALQLSPHSPAAQQLAAHCAAADKD